MLIFTFELFVLLDCNNLPVKSTTSIVLSNEVANSNVNSPLLGLG